MSTPKDPINDLATGLAADHAATKGAKKAKAAKPATGDPAIPDNSDAEAKFIGDFDSFDAVRGFANEEGFNIEGGDMVVINGSLCRYTGKVFEVVVNLLDEYAAPADHIESFNAALTSIERVVLGAKFESGTLMAGLRDVIIGMFKARPKAWGEMSQAEQRDLAKQIEGQSTTLIRKIARVIAEGEEVSVIGKLESYSHKGSFDLKISSPAEEEAAIQLFRMQGHDIVIVSADAKRFIEDAPDAITDSDEPELFPSEPDGTPIAELAPKEAAPADDSDLAPVKEISEEIGNVAQADDDIIEDPRAEEFEETNVVPIVKPGEEKPVSLIAQVQGAETVAAIDGPLDTQAPRKPSFGDGSMGDTGHEPGDYESRSNPEDEKDDTPKADFYGKQPADAKPGQTWVNESDPRVRYFHPNGKWYLSAPTEEALAEWRAANEPQGNDFDDEPVA